MWVMMAASAGVMAQKEGFGYKFYGQVRTDLFYPTQKLSMDFFTCIPRM